MKHIPFETVVTIAAAIAHCDFRTVVNRYSNNLDASPWVITVGETDWCRHLVVMDVRRDGCDATLGILSPNESNKPIVNIDTGRVIQRMKLSKLIADRYAGVKETLKPYAHAA